jgi:hypothetical protein
VAIPEGGFGRRRIARADFHPKSAPTTTGPVRAPSDRHRPPPALEKTSSSPRRMKLGLMLMFVDRKLMKF